LNCSIETVETITSDAQLNLTDLTEYQTGLS